jgi:hypothetical protein
MHDTRRHGLASGSLWMLGLGAVAWGCLSLTGGPGSSTHAATIAAAAPAVDTTPPHGLAVTGGPNADGWYHAAADYRWSASDLESGIASCSGGAIVPAESSTPRTVYGTCTNGAGLSAPYAAFSYRFDETPPTLHATVTRSVVTRFGILAVRARGADSLSGIATQVCNGDRPLNTRRLGLHTVTCVAQDRAGNFATATATYVVVEPGHGRH